MNPHEMLDIYLFTCFFFYIPSFKFTLNFSSISLALSLFWLSSHPLSLPCYPLYSLFILYSPFLLFPPLPNINLFGLYP